MLMDKKEGKVFSVKENGHKEYWFKVIKSQMGEEILKENLVSLTNFKFFDQEELPFKTCRLAFRIIF
jgi:hypothetical protein